jgi:hypothetical protein
MLEYIAEISNGHQRNGMDDIISFNWPLITPALLESNLKF